MLAIVLSLAALVLAAVAGVVGYSIVFPRVCPRRVGEHAWAGTVDLAQRLREHVAIIASHPHNLDTYAHLCEVAAYIEKTLGAIGYEVTRQVYAVAGKDVCNIEVVLEPADATAATPTYVIGAHYDSPQGSPGANDNGTGVAALLELARALVEAKPPAARLRLVFFVNVEHPYGKTPDMGSWRYAKTLAERGEHVGGMMALETIGHFSQAPGSQKFPFPFGLVYPSQGNFVAFVALPGGRRFLHRVIGSFRRHSGFPSIGGVAPGFIEGIDLSDHWAFHQFGFPALMLTDTAPFRNPYYHTPDDTPETVDYPSLALVTRGLEGTVRDLAGTGPPGSTGATARMRS